MTYLAKSRASAISWTIILLGIATLSLERTANASPDFPAALQVALEAYFPGQKFCVPLCTACHNTTKGGPGDINPTFGKNLEMHGPIIPTNGQAYRITAELKTYLTSTPGPNDPQVNGKWDSDRDGISDEQELKDYSSPSIAGPLGEGQFCSDLKYGCGAHIASAPPALDKVGLFSAGLVVAGLILLRRRRR